MQPEAAAGGARGDDRAAVAEAVRRVNRAWLAGPPGGPAPLFHPPPRLGFPRLRGQAAGRAAPAADVTPVQGVGPPPGASCDSSRWALTSVTSGPRATWRTTSSPGRAWATASVSPSPAPTGWPLTPVMTSPGCKPAFSAGV